MLPGAAGNAIHSAGLVVALSLAVFTAPLGIWVVYSRQIVSAGGLSAFVQAAAGRRAAVAHGWVWAIAYFLYLPSTVTYIVYELLPPVFPGISAYRVSLELVLPIAIVAVVLAPVRWVLVGLGALAVAQVATMLVLAGYEFSRTSAPFASQPGVDEVGRATAGTALLFICSSLPLYLAAEVRGEGRTVRRGLIAAVAIVGAAFLVAAIPLPGVPAGLRNAAVPGAAIARAYAGRGLAVTVGLLTACSALALIVAEYLALGRLLHWLHGAPVRSLLRWIALPFVAADAISLVEPERFYDDLLKPSLVALFTSQLMVFLAFPRYQRGPLPIVAAVAASALAIWGLYTV